VDVDFEPQSAFGQMHALGQGADCGLDIVAESLELASAAVVLPYQHLRREHLDQRFGDRGFQPFHAGGRRLRDHHRAVTVDREAGQAVALAEHQPVARLDMGAFAQRERDVQAMHDQRAIEFVAGAVHQARADQAGRIDVAGADALAGCIDDPDRIAGLETVERRTLDIDFVTEHPEMTLAQPAVLAATEEQRRIVGLCLAHIGISSKYGRAVYPAMACFDRPLECQ
jgi:hypothetical protein